VTADRFYVLGPASALRLPNFIMPRLMNNHRNFIGSLGNVVRFLGAKAAALGVDIFPGFSAAQIAPGDTTVGSKPTKYDGCCRRRV
jgi:electron-transferring-flavoprotein dehydrogenase